MLLDTMVWMNGLFFALRSGSEHRNLTFDQLECRNNVLIYTESQSKNRQGGLLERNEKPKVVYITTQMKITLIAASLDSLRISFVVSFWCHIILPNSSSQTKR